LERNWEGTGLPSQRRSGTIPSNRIPVMEVIRTIPANTERRAGEKKCVEQMIAGIRW